MQPTTPESAIRKRVVDAKIDLDTDSYCGLSHKSVIKLKYGLLGKTRDSFDRELLQANEKLQVKMENRNS